MTLPLLLVPEKSDIESQQVAEAWINNGGPVKRLGKYWIKEHGLGDKQLAVYGNQTFSLVLAQLYGFGLISPDDTLITRLDQCWTKRRISLRTIEQLTEMDFPAFIKPVIPKLFVAGIFQTPEQFNLHINHLASSEQVLIADIIDDIRAEARGYVMDGLIKDLALYEGSANLEEGRLFLSDFLQYSVSELPEVTVVDMAYNTRIGWFILEFNACWGAGLNNCDAEKVVECIARATKRKDHFKDSL